MKTLRPPPTPAYVPTRQREPISFPNPIPPREPLGNTIEDRIDDHRVPHRIEHGKFWR